jgi:hypothetical protein
MTAPEHMETLGILPEGGDDGSYRQPENLLDTPPLSESDTPPVIDNTPAPATFPPAPDLSEKLARLMDIQAADIERRQRDDAARQQQATVQAAPVPLMQQAEWKAAYAADLAASSYDEGAAARVMERQSQLADERATALMDQRFQQFEQRNTGQMLAQQAPTLIAQSAALVSRENPLVTGDLFGEAAREVFGDNQQLLAQALSDPAQAAQTRKMIGIYAAGLAATRGQVGTEGRPAPPVNARPTAQTGRAAPASDSTMWGDTSYVNGVLADAWNNPYGAKK